MNNLLLIMLGGAFGTLARYGIHSQLLPVSHRFPYSTLAINLLGCLAVGFVHALLVEKLIVPLEYRLALTVGVLGGFTTFSTFGWETMSLMQHGHYLRAGMNVLVSNVAGIALVFVGHNMGTRL